MDSVKPQDVAAILTSIAAYGGQLATVFHSYAFIAERVPSGFEGATNIFDSTVTILKQLLALVKDEADGKKLFSNDGLRYVSDLAQECANTFAKVEPIVAEACLGRKERKIKRKQNRKAASRKSLILLADPLTLKLDEKAFSQKVENASWSWASEDIARCIERLYEIQLHLLLVFEVISVGALSEDLTSGKADVQSIVKRHERIHRTADLIGIKAPEGRHANLRRRSSFRSSDSGSSSSSDSSTGSDSDVSSIMPKIKKMEPFRRNPPPGPPPPSFHGRMRGPGLPPPGPPPNSFGCFSPGQPPPGPVILPPPPPKVPIPGVMTVKDGVRSNSQPPAYEARAAPIPLPQTSPILPKPISDEKSARSVHLDEKAGSEGKHNSEKTKEVAKIIVPEGRLFKAPSNSFSFKLKSFLRSKESLAAEMRAMLSDSESHLRAYVLQRHDIKEIPHSVFHTLEATHMATILSQLHGNEWFNTFRVLDLMERGTVNQLVAPQASVRIHKRELVVLKVLKQNRMKAWMAVASELIKNRPLPGLKPGRVLLAIVREKFINGKPLEGDLRRGASGPPPPSPFPIGPPVPTVRAPPMPYTPPRRTTISDLKGPYPPPWPPIHPCSPIEPPRGPPGPPPHPGFYNGPPGPATRICDITPTNAVNDVQADAALTTFNEYTLRIVSAPDNLALRTWSRVSITQENSEKYLLQQRIDKFKINGGNVIEVKLRLTEPQSSQVTRLMEDLKCTERDSRFEWAWVEISVYDDAGEITVLNTLQGLASANRMHLIAKRSLKLNYKPLDVYNGLMRPPPRPPVQPTIINVEPPKPKTKNYVSSSSESDSERSSSSDSSVGQVRRELRKYRARKMRKNKGGRRFYNDSDSDSDDSDDEDTIAVEIILKRGEDVAEVLLRRWTPSIEVQGNGKGKGLSTNF